MKRVVLSTVLSFDSREEIVNACIECIENNGFESDIDSGVPESWEDEDTWTDDVIHEFLMYQGTAFYDNQRGDYDDLFNDDVYETRVSLE